MSSSSAQSPAGVLRLLAQWVLPWLCSTTAHVALFLLLALAYDFRFERVADQGADLGSGLQAVFIGSNTEGELDGGPDQGYANRYYEDDRVPFSQHSAAPHAGGGGGGSQTALTALLSEKPGIDLNGVLPSPGKGAGMGGLEGDGVGSAQGLTTQPQGSNRLSGGYARTGVFGASGEGHKFVYVFDRSASMEGHGGAPLSAAKAELIASLQNLGQTHQFQIIFYNEHPKAFNPTGVLGRLVFGTEQNKYLAQKFVGSITADGATRHDEALAMAMRMVPDVVFFFTDADEPRMTSEQLARIAGMNKGTQINTIEFGYGEQTDLNNFLVRLAKQNGGQHVYVNIAKLPGQRR